MKSLSPAQHNHVLSLLDAGQSACQISSKLVYTTLLFPASLKARPHLQKSSGGRPSKLSSADVCLAQRLITTRKAENAVFKSPKPLRDIKNMPPVLWKQRVAGTEACKMMGGWMGTFLSRFLDEDLVASLDYMARMRQDVIFQQGQ